MHAYLLIGQRNLEENIKIIIGSNNKPVPFELQKIDDVRSLQSLAKFKGNDERYFVSKDFQNASIEAMNAFLKLLEEPGENVNFILCATFEKNIPDTIISRCKVIRLGHKTDPNTIKSANKFLNANITEKLKIIHNISKKDEALSFLSGLIEAGHFSLTTQEVNRKCLAGIIKNAIQTKSEIEKNANVTISLAKFALDLV